MTNKNILIIGPVNLGNRTFSNSTLVFAPTKRYYDSNYYRTTARKLNDEGNTILKLGYKSIGHMIGETWTEKSLETLIDSFVDKLTLANPMRFDLILTPFDCNVDKLLTKNGKQETCGQYTEQKTPEKHPEPTYTTLTFLGEPNKENDHTTSDILTTFYSILCNEKNFNKEDLVFNREKAVELFNNYYNKLTNR